MTPQDLEAENARLRAALEEIAYRTYSSHICRIAHDALGHQPNPVTVQLMAEIEREWAVRDAS